MGGATFYLTGLRESDGNMLNGKDTYKLNVPDDVPAKDFWSAIVYNMETKNFNRGVDIRLDVGRRHEPHIMTNCGQLTRPMMG